MTTNVGCGPPRASMAPGRFASDRVINRMPAANFGKNCPLVPSPEMVNARTL
jgi:hypothetical protein